MSCQLSRKSTSVLLATLFSGVASTHAAEDVVRPTGSDAPPTYRFSAADQKLLEEVQHASFLYFWNEVGRPAEIVRDRKKSPVASSAAIGFQLASLPIGVEHGWVTRERAQQRAHTILNTLIERSDNKKHGIYIHYPDLNTGGLSREGYETLASTVDHALLLAGAITASEYFGGAVAQLVEQMEADSNWRAFAVGPGGYLSMGWKPDDRTSLDEPGSFHKAHWSYASAEERLIYFLAAGASKQQHAIDPELYYRLKRPIKRHQDLSPYVVSWNGTFFTYVFANCYIDYRRLGPDRPQRFGVDAPRVDWHENSRRAALTHRARCIEQIERFKTFAPDRWGLSACAARDGYLVPQVRPNGSNADEWGEGTVAPYAAASAIMFMPAESVAAIRAYRELTDDSGKPIVWRDPGTGGHGFADSFNLDQNFASDDYVGIDQGPMLLAIENARTGLIWKLFMRHETARRAIARLKLGPDK